jgi:hypothetical protein
MTAVVPPPEAPEQPPRHRRRNVAALIVALSLLVIAGIGLLVAQPWQALGERRSLSWTRVEIDPDLEQATVWSSQVEDESCWTEPMASAKRVEGGVEVGVWTRRTDQPMCNTPCPIEPVPHRLDWDPSWRDLAVLEPDDTAPPCTPPVFPGFGIEPGAVEPGAVYEVNATSHDDVFVLRGRGTEGWGVELARLTPLPENEPPPVRLAPANSDSTTDEPLVPLRHRLRMPVDVTPGQVQLCTEPIDYCEIFTVLDSR